MDGLLVRSAQFDVIALVRPGGADKAVYRDMGRAGVTLVTADYYNMEALAAVLAGVDTATSTDRIRDVYRRCASRQRWPLYSQLFLSGYTSTRCHGGPRF
jgi:uncharacterized protein YbjT (DUF2867 family)